MRRIAPALVVMLLAAAVVASGIGPSSAQDAGTGTPDPATACATPGASPEASPGASPDASPGASPDAIGSPEATPIMSIEGTPGVDPGDASPIVEIICATPDAATPTS